MTTLNNPYGLGDSDQFGIAYGPYEYRDVQYVTLPKIEWLNLHSAFYHATETVVRNRQLENSRLRKRFNAISETLKFSRS